LAALLATHIARVARPIEIQQQAFWAFSLIPLRYAAGSGVTFDTPLSALAPFIGHAFIHGGWLHLGLNSLFLLQGGVPVARGLGEGRSVGWRFPALFGATAAAGAFLYLAFNEASQTPAVGASGAVCGVFGAYFIGARGDWRASLADSQIRAGIALFLGLNVGLAALARLGGLFPIAWEAHLGGFVAGMVLYPLLRPRRPPS
jgi:membrane associated rhomboid family serine protease